MDAKKVISSIAVGALLVGAGAVGGANLFPKEVQVETIKEVPVEVIKEVPKEVIKEVPVTQIVYQDKIVEVESADLDKVMDYVQDNIDEDVTVDYIVFETDSKIEAEAYIRENIVNLLSDEDQFDDGETLSEYRKSEVSIKHIEDAVVEDKDYDNKDLTLSYEVKVRAKESDEDAQYFLYKVTVPFEDGKLVDEDVEIELI